MNKGGNSWALGKVRLFFLLVKVKLAPQILRNIFICLPFLWATLPALAEPEPATSLIRGRSGQIPTEIGGLYLLNIAQDETIHYLFTLDRANPKGENLVEVRLLPLGSSKGPIARSKSFDIEYRGPMEGGRPASRCASLVAEVIRRVQENDPGGLIIPSPRQRGPDEGDGRVAFSALVNKASAITGLALVLLFLLFLPFSLRHVAQEAFKLKEKSEVAFWAVVVSLLMGLIARLLVPHRPVMYYMGYHLIETAEALDEIPKYGSGALALYHLLFKITETDHLAAMYLNSVLGALGPAVAGAVIFRASAPVISVISTVALYALTPLFVHDAATESILVPMTFWLLFACYYAIRLREEGSFRWAPLALLYTTLAAYSRPEAVLLAPLSALVIALNAKSGKAGDGKRGWALWVLLGALALGLFGLRVLQLKAAMEVEFSRGNMPVMRDPEGLVRLIPDIFRRNVVFWPWFFPCPITALAALPILTGPKRPLALSLLSLGMAWIGVTLVDLPYVSITRIQVPGALFITMASSLGFAKVAYLLESIGKRLPLGPVLPGTAFIVFIVVTMASTTAEIFRPTNADDEEELLREARAILPEDEDFILVRRSYDDQPVERIHLYYPDYWFTPPQKRGLVVGPDWFTKMDASGRQAYFLLGTRCYMRACGEREIHPGCLKILEGYELSPLVEHYVPVRHLPVDRKQRVDQDLDFPWCIVTKEGEGSLRLGLYRIVGRKERQDHPKAESL